MISVIGHFLFKPCKNSLSMKSAENRERRSAKVCSAFCKTEKDLLEDVLDAGTLGLGDFSELCPRGGLVRHYDNSYRQDFQSNPAEFPHKQIPAPHNSADFPQILRGIRGIFALSISPQTSNPSGAWVQKITFERGYFRPKYLASWFILTFSGSTAKVEVVKGQSSPSREKTRAAGVQLLRCGPWIESTRDCK